MDPYRKNSKHLDTVVSIASIEVKSIAGQGKIYGEVMIEGSFGALHFLYNRSWRNPETKLPGDPLSLTGPTSPVSLPSESVVYLSLYDGDDDHEIAVGEFLAYFLHWESNPNRAFNRPRVKDFEGKFGSVRVTYSIIDFALYAAVKVVLIGHGGEKGDLDLAEVYGKIEVFQYFGEVDEQTSMILFDRSVDEAARVGPGEGVPLNRSMVEAPVSDYGSCLVFEVDLWVGDVQIAEGSFEYYVEYDGDYFTPTTHSFAGAGGGEVVVSITTNSNRY